MKVVEKTWGKEIWMANTDLYCGKILELYQGKRCSFHNHKVKDETFYIYSGKVQMELGDDKEIRIMYPGDAVHIPQGLKHRFTGLEDSEIIEISTHHEDSDSYRYEVG